MSGVFPARLGHWMYLDAPVASKVVIDDTRISSEIALGNTRYFGGLGFKRAVLASASWGLIAEK